VRTADYVRASFALGYAEYAADPTDEAKDLCAWLMEQDGDPMQLVEATRDMARLQGVRDTLRARRDALLTKWKGELRPLLAALARQTAGKVARKLSPHESEQADILAILKEGMSDEEWRALLTKAWQEAQAEGRVGGMAFSAALQGLTNVSLDQEFPQALDALRNIVLNDANQWIDRILNGTAYSLAQDLADALENGATYDDLLALADAGITDGGDAALMLDTMLSTGISAGSIDLYDSEGVTEVDILSSAVDDECADAASQNPWPLSDADGMVPFHPNCRCSVAPHF